ncbi:bifunctional [glutamine synthetase] adenylyltransferase/[glutamine synthetase]-adenylyl-L-tyrosine phosphorylase [Sphingobium sp.]|uniref:bifunctional [glutamine synthetase] adenylyltransferase/[glutamine synthetase]-adenylyl-L-tyrosine phosphorylase n=1 Tax=Sphingobium TaxID=165695 RepID=UPI001A200D6B|nr:bifunctional [glutamine synthetase] adenylyltransferase/[glutamine synthetase]-adenylyl-L-tyrosine phosphorylase [Sphingobium sp.]MBJ7375382.1 bifunctional [glutamine synthetase] adenylyltransferase/[glutamine synthetase]-adenylyl-L-tyrosine phosphorylase [Sphingobium sp.]MBJ7375443.1 bifunctional [glutamine synthetase] adenylyltransferase/[glutamine synthetase]-adenylyl-L-tyrosine phosphorylase [Sphingobium sp.]
MTDWLETQARIRGHSPFLARALDRFPKVTERLAAGDHDGALGAALAAGSPEDGVARSLRRRRGAIALAVAAADLAGVWDMDRVTRILSDFADQALEEALAAAMQERYPDAEHRGFVVLALGKHGSRELNYSSDIDPILLYDPATLPHREREDVADAAVRIGRRMSELLTARDGDGYVFRVDLRLRPSPEATPIALPVEAAIGYYESTAMGWEQAAFIRARPAAGDIPLGDYFMRQIRPFVWRRSLDFGAIDAIVDISRRIRDHYAQGQAFGPGYDLKRGRGGIREVEFFAQVHQLIHGGRDPSLRSGNTREALAALAAANVIDRDVAARLDAAYILFRTIEHRLQMVEDHQTHELPKSAANLDNVAQLHGLPDAAALLDLLRPHVEWVGRNYDRLSPQKDDAGLSQDEERLKAQLIEIGFVDPDTPLARIAHWRGGTIRALRSAASREALEALMPDLMRALAKAPDPSRALNRLDDMIGRLPSAINFFKLLAARPALVELLAEILSHAPTLADALGRRAELIDGLIDATAFDPPPPVPQLAQQLGALEPGEDYQALLDRVRQRVGDRRFALGAQIIRGGDPLEAGRGYGRVAQAAIEALATATVAEFEIAHGKVPGGEMVILALGRMGGGVLTHASDLDLVCLFTGDFSTESDGRKPLGATQYFNRLAQRITNALSVATAFGPLYEVDTRLRPSGAQGLLAVSLDSFAKYQREDAWTWEHLALTRARPVFGSPAARAATDAVLIETLRRPRDFDELARQAVKMRGDIAKHKPPASDLDVKLVPGGLVDLEFLIHVNQFRHGMAFDPDLGQALAELVSSGHLPADLIAAHDLITRYLVVSRLVSPKSTEPAEATRPLVARACGVADWDGLLASYAKARQCVGEAWAALAAPYQEEL